MNTKLHNNYVSILLVLSVILSTNSCTDKEDRCPDEVTINSQITKTQKLYDFVYYHEPTSSYMVPQVDPYSYPNFLSIYQELYSMGVIKESLEIQPTHYALKIFPKDEEEQTKIENNEKIKISYIPFNFRALSDSEVKLAEAKGLFIDKYNEVNNNKQIYQELLATDGAEVTNTECILPVLYALWPKTEPLPEGMEYYIEYDVFIPTNSSKKHNVQLAQLERAVIDISLGNYEISKVRDLPNIVPYNQVRLKISQADSLVKTKLPLENLKIQFRLGSNIWEIFTDSNGEATMPTNVPLESDFVMMFDHNLWKITNMESTIPITINCGTVYDNSHPVDPQLNLRIIDFPFVYQYQVALIHRGLNYYFHANHQIAKKYFSDKIRIKYSNYSNDGYNGCFVYSIFTNPYIELYNNYPSSNSHSMGVLFHELGHYVHYFERGNCTKYHSVNTYIQESFASYVSWYLTESYYISNGWIKPENQFTDISHNSRQAWKSNTSDNYTPMFVDLVDNCNQRNFSNEFNIDNISDVPHSIMSNISTSCKNWASVKSLLLQYVGVYYTSVDYNQYASSYEIFN